MRPLRRCRGPRCAVMSCAGAYVSGADGSNECPAGSVRIETEAACRTAVNAAGKTFSAVGTSSAVPRGCYYFTTNSNAWFNTHAVGAGVSGYQMLCAAAATTGGPPAPIHAHVCVCVCVCGCVYVWVCLSVYLHRYVEKGIDIYGYIYNRYIYRTGMFKYMYLILII